MRYFISCIKKYAVFKGRARRKEYWMFVLFYSILSTPFIIFDTFAFEKDGALFTFYQVALFLPGVVLANHLPERVGLFE